jgi:hypothetical protein
VRWTRAGSCAAPSQSEHRTYGGRAWSASKTNEGFYETFSRCRACRLSTVDCLRRSIEIFFSSCASFFGVRRRSYVLPYGIRTRYYATQHRWSNRYSKILDLIFCLFLLFPLFHFFWSAKYFRDFDSFHRFGTFSRFSLRECLKSTIPTRLWIA